MALEQDLITAKVIFEIKKIYYEKPYILSTFAFVRVDAST
jgi:hypothetical protein